MPLLLLSGYDTKGYDKYGELLCQLAVRQSLGLLLHVKPQCAGHDTVSLSRNNKFHTCCLGR
jgi:hypothetical protein